MYIYIYIYIYIYKYLLTTLINSFCKLDLCCDKVFLLPVPLSLATGLSSYNGLA